MFLDDFWSILITLVSTFPTGEFPKKKLSRDAKPSIFRRTGPISSFALKKICSIFTPLYGTNCNFIPPSKKTLTGRSQTIETLAVVKAILYCLTWLTQLTGKLLTATSCWNLFWGEASVFCFQQKVASIYSNNYTNLRVTNLQNGYQKSI